ncbi:MAG: ABC transporter permease subunit [Streptosporangiales bacterium]|nr:ABC transporter permease subunit [Streptosporangiales bacterium]
MVRRFAKRRLAVVGLVGVVVVVLTALFAPLLAPYDPSASDYGSVLEPPFSPGHLLGTDDVGRDLLSRVIVGARASLTAGVLSTFIAVCVAVPIGLVAGYYRGWIDPVISRVTDVVLSFPFLILAVGLAAILGPSLMNATIALAVGQIPQFVRITRGEVLGLRELEYVEAAVVNGAPDRVVLFKHILPNTVNPLIVQATVAIPTAIIGAAILSFLGLGEQPPTPSWGTMLSEAQQYIAQSPWYAVFPGLAIALTTLSFNLFGDGLRDVLDVRTST